MNHLDGKHVWGQVAKPHDPTNKKKFPGLLILQWASPPYPLQKSWVTDRAAEGWLAVNIEPHDVMPDQPKEYYDALPEALKKYNTIETRNRDKNYFLYMYLADIRAVDYLASRPDWDGKTLVVMGTSMGGQQSLCAAGLHPKVTAMLVNVPAGADANGTAHGRKIGYPIWDVERSEGARDRAVLRHGELRGAHQGALAGVDGLHRHGDAAGGHLGRVQPDPGAEGSRADDRLAAQPPRDARAIAALDAALGGLAGALVAGRPPIERADVAMPRTDAQFADSRTSSCSPSARPARSTSTSWATRSRGAGAPAMQQ